MAKTNILNLSSKYIKGEYKHDFRAEILLFILLCVDLFYQTFEFVKYD